MASLGEQFRAAREARGITLSEAAERIHIRSVYLQAIEEEDWPSIGAAVYVRGFLRTYARFLGLDPEDAVAQFNELTGIRPPSAPLTQEVERAPAGRAGPSIWVWLAGIVAIALLAIVGYSFWQLEAGGATSAPMAAPTPPSSSPATPGVSLSPAAAPAPSPAVTEAVATPTPSPVAGLETVTLSWTAPSWIRVVVDGKQVSEGTFPAATVRTYQGASITIRVGNAGGVRIKENGRDLGALGGTGDVVDRTFSARAI